MAGYDHFTSLPTELKHSIMDYIYASHSPDKAKFEVYERYHVPSPDLLSLARASKSMYAEVSSWAHSFLLKHADITKYRESKTLKAAASHQPLNKFVVWSKRKCAFCGKATVRSAILMNGLKCCQKCDRKEWPNKITKTEAKKRYRLSEELLFPLLTRHGRSNIGFRRPRYGTYICQGTLTTMFDEADVRRFAELAHGGGRNLRASLKEREDARLEKQRRQEELKASAVIQLD